MPSFKRPGVYISEVLGANYNPVVGSTTLTAFIGSHFRGDTTKPVTVRSWADFVNKFGGFPPTGTTPGELPYAVFNYFSNGGREAAIVRVVGSGALKSTVTLLDRAGSPQNTLKLEGKNVGAWGNNLRVSIVDRDAANGRFDLLVYYGGTTDPFLVERWLDVSMVVSDSRYVVSLVNDTDAGSNYLVATNMNSATAAPNNMPAAQTGTVLASGADGSAVGTAEYTAAVTAATSLLEQLQDGPFQINIPGVSTASVIAAADTYAQGRGDCVVIADPPSGQTVAQMLTYKATLPNSGYTFTYFPWVYVPDANTPSGAARLSPPGPLVAGEIAETDTTRGVWKAPAGLQHKLNNVVALERTLSPTELDDLNNGHVNAIRLIAGAGVVIWGARTLKTTTADKYVPVRRTLNYVKDALTRSTAFAVFEPNDQQLWNSLTTVCSRFLTQLWSLGGLKGSTPDEAFYVVCNDENNTPATIAAGEVNIEIGVALQNPAEFVVIKLGQWEGGNNAAETL